MLSKCLCGNSHSAATLEEIAKVNIIQVEHRAPFPDSWLIIIIIIVIIILSVGFSCFFFRYHEIFLLVFLFRE
jgi:hypothetical protein